MDPKKRGQVTLFIIIAMVIIIVLAIVIYVVTKTDLSTGDLAQDEAFVQSQIGNIQNYVSGCIDESLETQVPLLFQRAGKNQIEPNSLRYQGASVNYLLYDGVNTMVAQSTIETRLAREINAKLVEDCSFNQFDEISIKQEIKRMSIDIGITNDLILVTADYPLVLRKGKYQTTINEFSTDYESNFGELYNMAGIITRQETSNGVFDPVVQMSKDPNLEIKKTSQSLTENVYVLSKTEGEEFLIFATQGEQ